MNQNLFRLVFNAARGQVMAVSEVAVGKGKTASGERRARNVAVALMAFALSPLAWPQIVADPNAAGSLKPQIFQTANGITQVNIQTPSAAGVSRNVYSQFDVNAQGAILNNATGNVQTQLGGWVQGNSNLAGGSARVILNEVNSSNPSQLRGYVEVAGQRAEVIIANPAGIAVNGGGFINASGVTLTTGTPQLNGGNLEGYRVERGTVTVNGTGLDTNAADYTNIIARAVQVNAGIWAKDLKVTTGANTVNAANTSATAIAGTGAAPTVALDVAALGGMYAGKITLVGTETGVGVNNAGSIVARGGDLVLQVDGTLTNRGLIDAGNTVGTAQTRITTTTVDNLGTGAIFGDKVAISATTLNNLAESSGGTVTGATIGARTSLNLGVQTLNNSDAGLDTPGNPSTNTTATPSVNILSLGDINIGGSIGASGQAQGSAASINNTSATIQAGGNIALNATAVNNTDAHFASTTQNTTTAISETIGSAGAGYYVNVTQQTVDGPIVTAALPGTISAAGNLTVQASTIDNANSRMLAGGTVSLPVGVSVNNAGVTATKTTTKTGTAYTLSHDRSCQLLIPKGGGCAVWGPWYDVWTPSGYSSPVVETVTAGAGSATSNASATAPSTPGANVANSSLFQISTNPSANYVVATNPAFTNYRTWLGSDYITSRVSLDPSVTQKRLGDGFYEQRLINEQVAQLTGKRFLGNFTSDDAQYRALMDAGVTYAQTFNLRPGIALTAEQIARLTSDIVWLQQETVTLPDGSQTVALVPQIYLKPRSGDLSPSGGLISGAVVNINTADLNNSGTILGRQVVQINADTINNLGGRVGGDAVALTATQDINNTGGTITAKDQLALQAGRDINITSTTATASSGDSRNGITNTTVDRVAGLYVTGDNGVLLASAGRDINIIAGQIKNTGQDGQTVLLAKNDINLGTVQTSQVNNLERDSGNFRRATSTADSGSSIEGAGSVTLSAANDVNARAATVTAGKTLDVAAGNNIILQAGQATTNVDQMASASGKDLFFSSSIQTRRQEQSATAQVSSFTGQSTNIVAQNNLVSIGAKLEATGVDSGTGTLRVEGQNNTLLYEVQDFKQVTTTTQTKTGLGVMFDPLGISPDLENKTVTDARATSTAIGTKLVSTQKIEIGVGNKTELRGTEVEAPQIAFVKTDASKAGELILGGSTNTTQTSHTEKTETAGVYQEMKGNGSTVETLNQTILKGNVNFDAALKITAQIPDTKGGQELQKQIVALVGQGGNTGLEYLNQLAANPNVKWDKVALAHEKWSYDQAGLTGAGAALLTIVVAYFTAGTGATALGGTAATSTSAATLMGSTTLATAVNAGFSALASQAAVAMVNNKGDIGKTLEQLGKEESIKNLVLTMVTAGALDKLGTSMGWDKINAKSSFIDQFQKNLGTNIASDMMNSALAGKPFDETSLQKSLAGALTTAGMAYGANAIGDGLKSGDLNVFTHKVAHALLGCAGGAAIAGNGNGCAPGAVGAVVGELAAQYYNPSGDPTKTTDTVNFAKSIAAVAGIVVGGGGDNTQAVNIAATAGANAAQNNRQLHPDERKLAAQLAAKSKGLYTAKQIEDAMRNSGNGKLGEGITTGMVVDPNDRKAIYDSGAQWNLGGDGKSLVQVLPNGGNVAPDLAAFILANTGGNNSAYSWYDSQLGKSSPIQPSAGTGNSKQRYGQFAANGKIYTLPIADCPAVSCTEGTPIARYGVSADDTATIAAFDAAKKKEMAKDAVTGGLIVATTVALPATALGATVGGAIVGGGSSAANQTIDDKPIDAAEVSTEAAKGAVLGLAGYGVVKGVGIADDVLSKAGASPSDAATLEAQVIAKQKIENNVTADMPGYGKTAVRDFEPGATHRAENINAGQVTDRDGLPRIDEIKKANDDQLAQNLNLTRAPYYGTQRPAWMEGTTVEDKVLVKPETYRMVVNESEYEAIRTAVQRGDSSAAQNLGGWATKDSVTSAADVRGKLAISSEWKGQDGQGMYVIEFTVKPGVGVREGTVGPMFDDNVKTTLPGGGHQVQFLDKSPRTNPELYQIDLSKSGELK